MFLEQIREEKNKRDEEETYKLKDSKSKLKTKPGKAIEFRLKPSTLGL